MAVAAAVVRLAPRNVVRYACLWAVCEPLARHAVEDRKQEENAELIAGVIAAVVVDDAGAGLLVSIVADVADVVVLVVLALVKEKER